MKSKPKDSQQVTIATLKAHLAKYLRLAEAGQTITVVNHQRPVARLVGLQTDLDDGVRVVPAPNGSDFAKLKLHPVGAHLPDIVATLIEDRRKR